ncbi:hypothetical protein D3C86_1571850 [compost metagenome]
MRSRASSGVKMSPLPMTGMRSVRLTSPIRSQSALPEYCCTAVRPWIQTASAPHSWAILAISNTVRAPTSQPRRILTVMGTRVTLRTAEYRAATLVGSFMRAAPFPLLTSWGEGHPQLMSIRSAPASWAISAARASGSGAWPAIWSAAGLSSGRSRMRSSISRLPTRRASLLTISVESRLLVSK